jgi:hypothetical protein
VSALIYENRPLIVKGEPVDSARFDALVKTVASSSSRRRVLAGLAGSALGLFGLRSGDARTCTAVGTICREHANCCSGLCGPKDAIGRRRCQCHSPADCPTPTGQCQTATCLAGTCGETAPGVVTCEGNCCTDPAQICAEVIVPTPTPHVLPGCCLPPGEAVVGGCSLETINQCCTHSCGSSCRAAFCSIGTGLCLDAITQGLTAEASGVVSQVVQQ